MQRLTRAVCAVLAIASVFGAAGAATAALTVTIVQPATNPSSAEVDAAVAFEAVAFNDGQELEYANVQWLWEFGDAMQSTNNPTSHAYVAAGDYTVTVTATFNQAQASATTHVIVEDGEETPNITDFDSSLSIYVGFRGHWINYASGESEFAEIEAPVAVFQPGEEVADDPDTWGSHLINYPQAPPGWCFFSVDDSEPMEMHVIVRDTQNRLGDVVITDRDTGAPVGTITANATGSEIDGYVTVSPSARYFLLNIRNKSAATMVLAATDNSKVEDAIVITHSYGFDPNRGDQHACKIAIPGPWGNPETLDDTKVAFGPGPGGGFACAGPRVFFNDADDENQETPLYNPLNKRVLQDVNPDSETLPQPAYAAINAAVNAARAEFTGGAQFLSQYLAPPFSQGTVHWIFSANGHITSLVCLPYAGKPDDRGTTASAVDLALDWSLGDGHLNPSFKITWKYGVTAVQKRNWRVGSPIPVGDLFGFTGVNPWPPDAQPLKPITTEVTFTMNADKTPWDDEPGLMGGGATVTRLAPALTTPPPPSASEYAVIHLEFPSDDPNEPGIDPGTGTRTVSLQKGFKYSVTWADEMGQHDCSPTGPHPYEFAVPDTTSVALNVKLDVRHCLEFRTFQNGQPVQAYVEVKTPSGACAGENSQQDGEHYIVRRQGIHEMGDWQARAKIGDGDFGAWAVVNVDPGYVKLVKDVFAP